jgi:hypothetical protein
MHAPEQAGQAIEGLPRSLFFQKTSVVFPILQL